MQNPGDLITTFFERVWHMPHDHDAIDELMTEDYKITSGGNVIEGRHAFKVWVKEFHSVLLEAQTDSIDVFWNEAQDMVVSRWICQGRNNGIFGLPPDGRRISFSGIAIWKVRDGKLAECWVERSALEAYRELSLGRSDVI